MDHSALLKHGGTVTERVNRFDGEGRGASTGLSKLQETRRIFEQQTLQVCTYVSFYFPHVGLSSPRLVCVLQEKQAATNRILLKKERASGFQGSRLDVVARFNGSTEALDRLDDPPAPVPASTPAQVPAAAASGVPVEAVSPTVLQLSAAFEKGDLRNNLYLPPRRSAPALAPKPKPPPRAEAAERKVRRIGFGNAPEPRVTRSCKLCFFRPRCPPQVRRSRRT